MACPHYNERTKKCNRSTQLVSCGRDKITQYCKGNYERCGTYRSGRIDFSSDVRKSNDAAYQHGQTMRSIAPITVVTVFLLCMFKFNLGLPQSIGAAFFAGLVVLIFTNKHH